MTIAELKEAIAELPDDMEVAVDLDLDKYHPYDGYATTELTTCEWNKYFYIIAKYDFQ